MKINKVGYKYEHDKDFFIHRAYGSGDWLILFLRTGATFILNGKEVECQPQSMILYKRGTPQYYQARGECFVNDWVHFELSAEEERALIEQQNIRLDCPMPCGSIAFFSKMIKDMDVENRSANPYKRETLALYMQLILVKLAEYFQMDASLKNFTRREKFSALRAEIYNAPDFAWTVGEMAKKMILSESYFQHLYRKTFGVSPLVDVIHARIEWAQYLLLNTDYTISRIAEECGYENEVHFMRQFKKNCGVTPSEFRKGNDKFYK